MIVSVEDFFRLRERLPVVDVRSEGEYAAGHIPGAYNIPLLTNDERTAVGTIYKTEGTHNAIKKGFEVVGPRLLQIINQTEQVATQNEILVHCWRGGMRSANFSQFVGMAGITAHPVSGGYKAYRQEAHALFASPLPLLRLGGCTGSGKSSLLHRLKQSGEQVIDLEMLACHRGSVFGGIGMKPQPTTEQFENNMFEELRLMDLSRTIWVEDESIAIGKIFLPQPFWHTLSKSPVIEIQMDKAIRVQRLVEEYGHSPVEEFEHALEKISRRLGGQHVKAALEHLHGGRWPEVMEILLTYYDKAYRNGLSRKKELIRSVLSWDGRQGEALVSQLKTLSINPMHHWHE
jgi:tRNA 2-selenouridine synthase